MLQTLDLGELQARLDAGDDAFGKLVLKREDVAHVAFEAVGPDVVSVRGVDQLAGETYALAAAPHAAFEHVAHAELAADLADVDGLALVDEARVARDDDATNDSARVR